MRTRYIFLAVLLVILLILPVLYFSGYVDQVIIRNQKPAVRITYPQNDQTIYNLVMISGIASDADRNDIVTKVEIKIGEKDWVLAEGTTLWSYEWNAYEDTEGSYTIHARAYDGKQYSDENIITVRLSKPESSESTAHKWAIFIAAANFPTENESKLGNGGLKLAEEMADYLISTDNYPPQNVIVLFDDGWIRADNGFGSRIKTVQDDASNKGIIYGAATKRTVGDSLSYLIKEANTYSDSEVFIWIFDHGYGQENKTITGGKILKHSEIFLWDQTMSDRELGDILKPLASKKVCVIVDACYSGGFADKTILNLPTSLLLRSGIPQNGRIVIAGTSKFRKGYASTTEGPLFSKLWFEGLTTGDADGFRPGFLHQGKPVRLKFLKDGKVSVEEAFYYAEYMLRTDKSLQEYKGMAPQMNDRFPHRGLLLSRREMVLGQD